MICQRLGEFRRSVDGFGDRGRQHRGETRVVGSVDADPAHQCGDRVGQPRVVGAVPPSRSLGTVGAVRSDSVPVTASALSSRASAGIVE